MKILESKFVQGFIKMADDGYQQGWHERNGRKLKLSSESRRSGDDSSSSECCQENGHRSEQKYRGWQENFSL